MLTNNSTLLNLKGNYGRALNTNTSIMFWKVKGKVLPYSYRALGPELNPVYSQLARMWLSHPPGSRLPLYFPPDLRLRSFHQMAPTIYMVCTHLIPATHLSTLTGWKAELAWLADLRLYRQYWSPISCKSSVGQWKFSGQRPMLYHCATQPSQYLKLITLYDCTDHSYQPPVPLRWR